MSRSDDDLASVAAVGVAACERVLPPLPAGLSRESIARLAWLSDYVARQLSGNTAVLDLLALAMSAATSDAGVDAVFAAALAGEPDNPQRALRLARHALHLSVLYREWADNADVAAAFDWLSATADAALLNATRLAGARLIERHGVVADDAGRPVSLAILAMGKLGGRELNFSSDIDLVFLYRGGQASDGAKPLAADLYFTRWAREVVRLLDQRTADGFVHRVDVRLRPFGASGPLVASFASFEAYLETQGRDWERYAYLKARLVDGTADPDDELGDLLSRFVYRRYLDFGIFASLRDLKTKIETEVQRRDRLDDIKLGPGGIREVEFIVQSLQLIRGGREPQLAVRHLPDALRALAAAGHIDELAERELTAAYRFLRRVENAVQGLADEQTHRLPAAAGDRARVAAALGYHSQAAFAADLARHRERVQRQFNASELGKTEDGAAARTTESWPLERTNLAGALASAGVADAEGLAAGVSALIETAASKRLDALSAERLQVVLPLLLDELVATRAPAACWQRLGPVLEAVLRRSAYLALLIENRRARARLVEWLGRSEFLAQELAASPMLLDELLGTSGVVALNRADMLAEIETRLAQADTTDSEALLGHLADYQRTGRFRIALRDESGELPVMRVSDALTALAESITEAANAIAWRENVARYGRPRIGGDAAAGFCVVGYGKLGGFELGYGSDLDLVFLHDSVSQTATTDGAKPLSNDVFFARHVRKLIHYLTYQTAHGPLYEVDVRLRPSGRSGLLVTNIDAFERYQRSNAWTWEHQALLRSRAVVGDAALCTRFEALRVQLLCEAVRRETLRDDVGAMRERMRRELSASGAGEFDLKQDAGGMADIEFLVQYLILRGAADAPALLTYSDNVRQLDQLAEYGCLSAAAAVELQDVYLAYRDHAHRLALAGIPAILADSRFRAEREHVRGLWRAHFGD